MHRRAAVRIARALHVSGAETEDRSSLNPSAEYFSKRAPSLESNAARASKLLLGDHSHDCRCNDDSETRHLIGPGEDIGRLHRSSRTARSLD